MAVVLGLFHVLLSYFDLELFLWGGYLMIALLILNAFK